MYIGGTGGGFRWNEDQGLQYRDIRYKIEIPLNGLTAMRCDEVRRSVPSGCSCIRG